MVEIKCPYSRKISETPKSDYYNQMQLQLEVCDLSICHFLECEIKEYSTFEEYKNDGTIEFTQLGLEKGVIMEIIQKGEISYKYGPLNMSYTDVQLWIEQQYNSIDEKERAENDITMKPIYWYLTQYSCIPVYKNKNWITNNIQSFYEFWREILEYRKNEKWKELLKEKDNSKDLTKGICVMMDDSDDEDVEKKEVKKEKSCLYYDR